MEFNIFDIEKELEENGTSSHKKIRSLKFKDFVDLPYAKKVSRSKILIKEWFDMFGWENVALSFSGGKDSTVLLHLILKTMQEYRIEGKLNVIFGNTTIEYPQITDFARSFSKKYTGKIINGLSREELEKINYIEKLPGSINGTPVTQKFVYNTLGKLPGISKESAQAVSELRGSNGKKTILARFGLKTDAEGKIITNDNGLPVKKMGKLAKKYLHFIDKEFVKYSISHECCKYFKKRPVRQLNKKVFLGTNITESRQRATSWKKFGCNAYNLKNQASRPLSIWTKDDINRYITENDIVLSVVYSPPYNMERTGCYNCPFSIAMEELEASRILKSVQIVSTKEQYDFLEKNGMLNKFEVLKKFYPELYEYSMNILGFKKVLLDMMVKIRNDDDYMAEYYSRKIKIEEWHNNIAKNLTKIIKGEINNRLINGNVKYQVKTINDEEIKLVLLNYGIGVR